MYVWLAVHVPLPFDSMTVPVDAGLPSPHVIEQVCESFVPASVNEAESDTGELPYDEPADGAVMLTEEAAFETVTVALLETGALSPSLAVRVTT